MVLRRLGFDCTVARRTAFHDPLILERGNALSTRIRKGAKAEGDALDRALIFRRLRLSLRDLFFFHFSLMLDVVPRSRVTKE